MAAAKTLKIEGLFGYLNHEVELRSDGPTILTGPNGSGKTHVLKLLKALVALDFSELPLYPFATATLVRTDGTSLKVTRSEEGQLEVQGQERSGNVVGTMTLPASAEVDVRRLVTPDWIERVGPDEWYDSERDVYLSREVLARYLEPPDTPAGLADQAPWLQAFLPDVAPTFIETERLDVNPALLRREASRRAPHRRSRPPEPAINRYVKQIKNQITAGRRQSLVVSQSADRQFVARALDKARETVVESDLRRRYAEIAELHRDLHANGLTEQTIDVALPEGRTNPTERRILNVFLDDWAEKLAPLKPVHEKIQVLREIVDLKMPDKHMQFTEDGDVKFASPVDAAVSVTDLSSGEQHMLALFTMLLFSARPGGLVLVDEPEISLHAAWKHEFLSDIEKVTRLTPVTVVLATHSSALINSRWDLVEELGLT